MTNGPGVILGERRGPFEACLDGDVLRRFAAATKDPSPVGDAVPPVALVTTIWDAQTAGRMASVPAAIQDAAAGGVHGEHDVLLHRPIRPGESLRVYVEGHGARTAGRNSLVTLRYTTFDADEAVVAEQWWTTVFFGVTCDAVGEPAPDHAFPDAARAAPARGTYAIDVDADMARRYAEVSGDWSDHHFSVEGAKRSGFDRPFLHGLCTMALCGQAVTDTVAGGDPTKVKRIAVRFATPTFLDERLDVNVHDAGPLGFAFEATCAGATVVTHGRAELF